MNKHFSIVEGLNSFINSSIHKIFFLLISLSLTTSLWSAESVYKTALFGSDYNSKGVSSYTDTWTSTNDGFEVTIVNGNNNNNGWSVVKFGRKNNASVGEISAEQFKIDGTLFEITTTGGNGSQEVGHYIAKTSGRPGGATYYTLELGDPIDPKTYYRPKKYYLGIKHFDNGSTITKAD